jgi:hypothetical protein
MQYVTQNIFWSRMMTIEAMKLALEALENTTPTGFNMERDKQFYSAITALRTAIEQAEKQEQEPVAYLCENAVGHKYFLWKKPSSTYKPIALYTTPPAAQRQHVTDGSLCWCEPETSYTDPETGASVVVHKGPQ